MSEQDINEFCDVVAKFASQRYLSRKSAAAHNKLVRGACQGFRYPYYILCLVLSVCVCNDDAHSVGFMFFYVFKCGLYATPLAFVHLMGENYGFF